MSTRREKYTRDEDGLIASIEHIENEDGSINWRAMVKPEFLFPNREWFEKREKEVPKTIEDLKDEQLCINLAGIKELASLRGFNTVDFDVVRSDDQHATVKCTIEFIGNYETNDRPITFSSVANATAMNTSNFGDKFLETFAENRAFIRCVRNFLKVHVVGDEEIDKSDPSKNIKAEDSSSTSASITPVGLLKKTLFDKFGCDSFEGFKNILRKMWEDDVYRNEDAKDWNTYKNVPKKECRKLTSIIMKMD